MLMLPLADTPDRAGAAPGVTEGAGGGVGDEAREALVRILPWGVSLALHAALVLLAVFAVWSTIAPPEEEIVIPLVKLSDTPGAPLEMREIRKVTQDRQERRTLQQVERPREKPLHQKVELKTALIGVSGATGAKAAPFNTTVDASAQFRTTFFGTGGNARKVVFILDATGSLLDTFPFIIKELIRTVNGLNERQQYAVIFFNGTRVDEVPPHGWKVANADHKAATIDWLSRPGNVRVEGKGNPVGAMERALKLKPDLIYLLSDNITGQGRFMVDQKELLAAIRRLNGSGTKINTIQFLYPDPIEAFGGVSTMRLIAEQTGGVYRFVDDEELYLR